MKMKRMFKNNNMIINNCGGDDDDWGDFLDTCSSELSDRG